MASTASTSSVASAATSVSLAVAISTVTSTSGARSVVANPSVGPARSESMNAFNGRHDGDPIINTKDGAAIPNTYDNPSFFGAYKLKRTHKGLNEYMVQPTMSRLLSSENDDNGSWRGKFVLELGCGAGPTMVDSWKRGAQFVGGCDISERMLGEASASLTSLYDETVSMNGNDGYRSWRLAQAPLEDFDPATFINAPFKPSTASSNVAIAAPTSSVPSTRDEDANDNKVGSTSSDIIIPQRYNIVTAHLCLHYVSELASLFQRVYRWTLPGGAFVFSMMHPLVTSVAGRKPLRIMNNLSWDDSGVAISEPIGFQFDYYHDIGKRNATFIGHDVQWYHHTFSEIMNGLSDAGFTIERVEEPLPLESDEAQVPELREYRRRPEHLLVRARRPLAPTKVAETKDTSS